MEAVSFDILHWLVSSRAPIVSVQAIKTRWICPSARVGNWKWFRKLNSSYIRPGKFGLFDQKCSSWLPEWTEVNLAWVYWQKSGYQRLGLFFRDDQSCFSGIETRDKSIFENCENKIIPINDWDWQCWTYLQIVKPVSGLFQLRSYIQNFFISNDIVLC